MLFPSIINMSQHDRLLISPDQFLTFRFVSLLKIRHNIISPLSIGKRHHDILEHFPSLLENILDHRESLFSDSFRLTTECIPNLLVQSLCQVVSRSLLKLLFLYIKVYGKIFQHIHTETFQIISLLVFFHQRLAYIIHIIGNIHSDSLSQQRMTSFLVDHLTLRVHHVVIFQQTLTNTEVVFLHLTLRTFDRFGNHGMLDHVTFFMSQTIHHPNDSLGTEQTHQIILQ